MDTNEKHEMQYGENEMPYEHSETGFSKIASVLSNIWFQILVLISVVLLFVENTTTFPILMVIVLFIIVGIAFGIGKAWPKSKPWIGIFIVFLLLGSGWVELEERFKLPTLFTREVIEYQNEPGDPIQFRSSEQDMIVLNLRLAAIVVITIIIVLSGRVGLEWQIVSAIVACVFVIWMTYFPPQAILAGEMPNSVRGTMFKLGWAFETAWAGAILIWGFISSILGMHVQQTHTWAERLKTQEAWDEFLMWNKIYTITATIAAVVIGLKSATYATFMQPTVANIVADNPEVFLSDALGVLIEGQIVGLASVAIATIAISIINRLVTKVFKIGGTKDDEND